jgi:hypothetical protein
MKNTLRPVVTVSVPFCAEKRDEKKRDGTRARVRETGHCPVPFSRPVSNVPCPVVEERKRDALRSACAPLRRIPFSQTAVEHKAKLAADPRFAGWTALEAQESE